MQRLKNIFIVAVVSLICQAQTRGQSDSLNTYKNELGVNVLLTLISAFQPPAFNPMQVNMFYKRKISPHWLLRFDGKFCKLNSERSFFEFAGSCQEGDLYITGTNKAVTGIYEIFAGPEWRKSIHDHIQVFVGTGLNSGYKRMANEYDGEIRELQDPDLNVTKGCIWYNSSSDRYTIRRKSDFLKIGVNNFAGLQFIFLNRFSLITRIQFALGSYLLINSETEYLLTDRYVPRKPAGVTYFEFMPLNDMSLVYHF